MTPSRLKVKKAIYPDYTESGTHSPSNTVAEKKQVSFSLAVAGIYY